MTYTFNKNSSGYGQSNVIFWRSYAKVVKEKDREDAVSVKGFVEGSGWLQRSAIGKLRYLAAAGQIQVAFSQGRSRWGV